MYYTRYRLTQLYEKRQPQGVFKMSEVPFEEGDFSSLEECQGFVNDSDIKFEIWKQVEGYLCEVNEEGKYTNYEKWQKVYTTGEPVVPEEFKKGDLHRSNMICENIQECEEDIYWVRIPNDVICDEEE